MSQAKIERKNLKGRYYQIEAHTDSKDLESWQDLQEDSLLPLAKLLYAVDYAE